MTVRVYKSTDVDAPVLNGLAGSMLAVLDACLVNGYGTGPDEKEPAGWAVAFTGTNKRVYRAPTGEGNRFFYRFIDDGSASGSYTTRKVGLLAYESMTDVDTGTNGFWSAQLLMTKSDLANSDPRRWIVIADERAFYVFTYYRPDLTHSAGYFFGDLVAFDPADGFASAVIPDALGDTDPATDPNSLTRFGACYAVTCWLGTSGLGQVFSPRAWGGAAGTPARGSITTTMDPGHRVAGGSLAQTEAYQLRRSLGCAIETPGNYPSPVVGLPIRPVYQFHGVTASLNNSGDVYRLRALMPGLYEPLALTPFADWTHIDGINGLPGREVIAVSIGAVRYSGSGSAYNGIALQATPGQCLIDLTGPWR